MNRDEFKKLLNRYGNASEYVGEHREDPHCRITRLHKAEDEQERLWHEILEALDELFGGKDI